MTLVYPVIHYLDAQTTLDEAAIAFDCGADGIFLISHHGDDMDLLVLGKVIKARNGSKFVGINMLGLPFLRAHEYAQDMGLDGIWGDHVGVSSAGLNRVGYELKQRMLQQQDTQIQIFGSIAFKYQPIETRPVLAAQKAMDLGVIPTTSGSATGCAPTLEKISSMSAGVKGRLAVASGMTPENIAVFAPYLSHVLVSTGVSSDPYHFDPLRLSSFVQIAHAAVPPNQGEN